MSITIPDLQDVKSAFPQASSIEFLDAGGFKAVYKMALGSHLEALKIIALPIVHGLTPEEIATSHSELRARVNREVSVLAEMNILELVKLGSIQLSPVSIGCREYLAYSEEFITGKDLWKLIRANGPRPDESELRVLLLALLKAIRALWKQGIIHRDIKPANIMKTSDPDRPFILMDLGIAFSVDESGITENSAAIPSTLKYIAPEMLARGFRNSIDWRSDLYCTGLSVYEYAAFSHPLARGSDDPATTVSNALHKIPKRLHEKRQDISTDFCRTIDQMLKKKQFLRPSNLDIMIQNLEAGI